jgi:hypothetical protein
MSLLIFCNTTKFPLEARWRSPVLIRPERVSPVRSLGCVINPRANAMFYHSLAPDSEFGMNRGTSIV